MINISDNLMKQLKKIWQLITKDVVNDNELKKPAVIIRCSSIAMFLCCLINAIVMIRLRIYVPMIVALGFAAGFALIFYLAYFNITKTCYFMETILILSWVLAEIRLFGWTIGAQYFVAQLITFTFVTSHIRKLYKYLISIGNSILFLVMYFYANYIFTAFLLPASATVTLNVINIIFSCFLQMIIISLFCSDSLMQEEKLMEYNRKVTHLASTDPLTGLINRRSTKEEIANLIDADREEVPFISLAMGDIDYFKNVNDSYGHEGGDVVLKTLAECFLKETENIGLVCRWGGEEFLFILPGMNGDDAFDFIEKLRRKVKTIPFKLNNTEFNVSMTFGV